MARRKPKGAHHNLSHSFKYSDYIGHITPIACFDCVPGDSINHKIHALIRTQPLLAPLMHEVDVDVHAYFCPDRLVWDNMEDFHSGGDDGQDATVAPYVTTDAGGFAVGSLADMLGYPTGVEITAAMRASALPFRHYANIYNYHYRDSQLQSELVIDYGDGLDTTTSRELKRPAWKRDYFTKCRPEPQLGPEVVIPLGEPINVTSRGTQVTLHDTNESKALLSKTSSSIGLVGGSAWASNDQPITFGPAGTDTTGLLVDLSAATGLPITAFRDANATQRFQEANNIYGGRYMEQLMARFGVLPEDSRMQWPEFLGSGSTKIQFSEVLQTAEGTNPVGEMAGHGISVVGSNRYKYNVKEHGWCLVFMILRPKTQYMQGLPRHLSRETKFDYLLPEFVAIGDQAVLNKELYPNQPAPNGVFGYTPIYEEYRTIPSRVAGEFKTTFKYWHMAREFASAPALNSDFITCTPTARVFPDTTGPQIYVNTKHTLHAHRPLPKSPEYKLM